MQICSTLVMSLCRQARVWLILLLTLCSVSADVTKRCSWVEKPKNSAQCGQTLATTLSFVCDGKYNDGNKRSQPDLIDDENSAFMRKSSAFSYLHGLSQWPVEQSPHVWRVTRSGNLWKGVVCECCYNKCNLPEMCHYCMDVQKCKRNFGK